MNDVFGTTPTQGTEQPQGDIQQNDLAADPNAGVTPPVTETDKHVPLAALEDERSKRRDWKDKAIRAETELKLYREQVQRGTYQPGEQQQPMDPMQAFESRIQNMTLNASETMARRVHGTDAVDKAFETFQKAVAVNPSLHQHAMQQADPWDFVVREGKRLAFLEEVGDDPAAYRTKLEAEIRASLDPNAAPKTTPATPASLASARSSAARTAPGFTGPTPFNDIFK